MFQDHVVILYFCPNSSIIFYIYLYKRPNSYSLMQFGPFEYDLLKNICLENLPSIQQPVACSVYINKKK